MIKKLITEKGKGGVLGGLRVPGSGVETISGNVADTATILRLS